MGGVLLLGVSEWQGQERHVPVFLRVTISFLVVRSGQHGWLKLAAVDVRDLFLDKAPDRVLVWMCSLCWSNRFASGRLLLDRHEYGHVKRSQLYFSCTSTSVACCIAQAPAESDSGDFRCKSVESGASWRRVTGRGEHLGNLKAVRSYEYPSTPTSMRLARS